MKASTIINIEQPISCGFSVANPNLSEFQNRFWYGDFFSPNGCGANPVLSANISLPNSNKSLQNELRLIDFKKTVQQYLKYFDHSHLNTKANLSFLTPELFVEEVFHNVKQQWSVDGAAFLGVEVLMSHDHWFEFSLKTGLRRSWKFQMRSLLYQSGNPQPIDGQVELFFANSGWKSSVERSIVPLGQLEQWYHQQLLPLLAELPLDQWLQISDMSEFPGALFQNLKQALPHLTGVQFLQQNGCYSFHSKI